MILFVDDEPRRIGPYLEACEFLGLEARISKSVDDAWATVSRDWQTLDLVVLDVMMPVGERYSDNTKVADGVLTGLQLCRDLKRRFPNIPVLLLTQLTDPAVDSVAKSLKDVFLVRKQDILPDELADGIQRFLNKE